MVKSLISIADHPPTHTHTHNTHKKKMIYRIINTAQFARNMLHCDGKNEAIKALLEIHDEANNVEKLKSELTHAIANHVEAIAEEAEVNALNDGIDDIDTSAQGIGVEQTSIVLNNIIGKIFA